MNLRFNRPPANLTHVLDEVFNTNFSEILNHDFSNSKPSINIIEKDDSFLLELAAPGLKKDDFEIKVEKDQLIVKTSNASTSEEGDEKSKYRRREFNYNSFSRSFHLSNKVDTNKIDAKYENGVLILRLDKKEEAKEKEPRSILVS